MASKGQKFRSWTEDEKNQILEMYVGGAKIREISVLFKASIGTIGTILHTTRTIEPLMGPMVLVVQGLRLTKEFLKRLT